MALLSVIETSNHYWAIGLTALPHLTFVAPDWTPHCMGGKTGYAYEFMWRNAEQRSRNTASTGGFFVVFLVHDACAWMCLRGQDIFKCVCADIQGESGSLIDWCWFHLGSEQRLTVDLSRCERQPLILVLFKQHVLIYVIFTKSAREERLPFYVWLFIEVRGVPLYNPSTLPTRHLHRSGRAPEKWDPTPRI